MPLSVLYLIAPSYLMKMAEDLVAQMESVYQKSTLPHKPDLEQINELCMELVEIQGW